MISTCVPGYYELWREAPGMRREVPYKRLFRTGHAKSSLKWEKVTDWLNRISCNINFKWIYTVISLYLIASSTSSSKVGTISLRDRSQTLVRGGQMQKIFIAKNFWGPPSDRKKKSGPPPFLPWKLRVNPIEKHVNSIFNGKSVVIFFRSPLQGSKIFRAPLFASGPLTSVCERSLIQKRCSIWVII